MESLQRRKLWKYVRYSLKSQIYNKWFSRIFNFGVKYYNSTSAFKSFNNTVGVKYPIIPNIVHFLKQVFDLQFMFLFITDFILVSTKANSPLLMQCVSRQYF